MKKVLSTLLVVLLLAGTMAGCTTGGTSDATEKKDAGSTTGADSVKAVYIEAPYKAADEEALTREILKPVFYENKNGPTIGVTLVGVIQIGDMYFRDSNNNRQLDRFEDWRLTPEERAEDLVSRLTLEEKAGLVLNTLMASPGVINLEDAMVDGKVDFKKIAGETEIDPNNPYASASTSFSYKSVLIGVRAGVARRNSAGAVFAYFNNALEQCVEYAAIKDGGVAIPYTMISNPMSTGYPSSLGMAAAVMGDVAAGGDYSLISDYAKYDAKLWSSKGLDFMYGPQIDLLTDPRWSRNSGTYGEVPEVVANIITELVKGYQNGTNGLDKDSISLAAKHFPGDGAAENGFESHNYIGQWRLYPTEGSLEKYQLVAFQAAIDANVGAIMPGYSRPTRDGVRSASQTYRGVKVDGEEIGNAYNPTVLQTLLRGAMGFKGVINTDSGIISSQTFGAEDLSVEERIAACIEAGTDVIGDRCNIQDVMNAVNSGVLDIKALERANKSKITMMMKMNRFDNPYVDPDNADKVEKEVFAAIEDDIIEANRKSYVLLKNSNKALPLKEASKKVFVKVIRGASSGRGGSQGDPAAPYKELFTAEGYTIVDDYNEADIAFLYVSPSLNNSQQMAVIDLVEGIQVDERNYPDSQELTGNKIICTTAAGINDVPAIAESVHGRGGKVIAVVNFSNPWILTNLEPYCDGLFGQFGGSNTAMMDVITGRYNPTGKLPMTLVSSNEVIAVEWVTEKGVTYEKCVSPNDVPGYDKDQYIDKDILAKVKGGSYAYCDSEGNYYRAWFGLSY